MFYVFCCVALGRCIGSTSWWESHFVRTADWIVWRQWQRGEQGAKSKESWETSFIHSQWAVAEGEHLQPEAHPLQVQNNYFKASISLLFAVVMAVVAYMIIYCTLPCTLSCCWLTRADILLLMAFWSLLSLLLWHLEFTPCGINKVLSNLRRGILSF